MFIAAKNKKLTKKKSETKDTDSDDQFYQKFKKEEKKEEIKLIEVEQKQRDEMKRKTNVFMILWLRQIVIYNTYYVFHQKLTDLYIDSILDIRPSIVKATSIKYALISLLNPRLRSAKQLQNLNNMRRILDNNLTYFFENFLSCNERSLICKDLHDLKNNHVKISQLNYLNFNMFL